MKKHPVNNLPAPPIQSIVVTQPLPDADKKRKKHSYVPPPDEETVLMANKIAKQSPFCYYYKGKSGDLL